jgi:hypothetical protein
MKKIMNRFLYPSKKDFLVFTGIQVFCVAVLWFISEKRSDYFVSSLFSFSVFSTSLLMWIRTKRRAVLLLKK